MADGIFLGWSGFDTTSAGIMFQMSGEIAIPIHGINKRNAIILIIIYTVWATIVLLGKDESAITSFHRFSVIVCTIWLVSYFAGFLPRCKKQHRLAITPLKKNQNSELLIRPA